MDKQITVVLFQPPLNTLLVTVQRMRAMLWSLLFGQKPLDCPLRRQAAVCLEPLFLLRKLFQFPDERPVHACLSIDTPD
jgi:hypothetical protein